LYSHWQYLSKGRNQTIFIIYLTLNSNLSSYWFYSCIWKCLFKTSHVFRHQSFKYCLA